MSQMGVKVLKFTHITISTRSTRFGRSRSGSRGGRDNDDTRGRADEKGDDEGSRGRRGSESD